MFRAILIVTTGCASVWAQSYQGGIRGAVLDPSAGSVAGAKVSLIDQETNAERLSRTNSAGEYVFSSMHPSKYRLIVDAEGFSHFERADIVIGTQEFVTLDVTLDIRQVTGNIVVKDELPLLETSNASNGQVLDRQKLIDLPNLGRNPFMLAKITQNAVAVGDPRFNRMQDQDGSSAITISGGPVRGNNYLLDGIPITDSNNRAVIIPSTEAVQEVKIHANTYDAEIGRTGGGVFNTYLKSGSNQLHGSAFGYMRDPGWQANTFFNNRFGLPREEQPYKTYGGSLGGRVWLPHLYDGRNRTFFHVGVEGYRQTSGLSVRTAVPTAAERIGDFSRTLSRAGGVQQIFDPLSTRGDGAGGFLRDAFPGNIIPAARVNPIGRAMASYYPLPTSVPAYYGGIDIGETTSLSDRADQRSVKVDHQVTSWWRATLSYLRYHSREPGPYYFNNPASPGAYLIDRKVDATQVSSVFTPNASTVVNVRYGFNRFPNDSTSRGAGFNLGLLGFPDSYVRAVPYPDFPIVVMQNLQTLGNAAASNIVYASRNFLAGVSKLVRIHSLKAGMDYRKLQNAGIQNIASQGYFTVSDQFTRSTPVRAVAGTGADLASLLLGYPSGGGLLRSVKLYQWVNYWAGYFQDDMRISHRLTMNVGLRYEFESGLYARDNAMIVGFDRSVVNPLPVVTPGVSQPHGGLMYAGVGKNPLTTGNPSRRKFAPRIGAAWIVDPKTTLRGGYGLFWVPLTYDLQLPLGYTQTTLYVATADGGATPAGTLSNPFPDGIQPPVGNSQGLLAGIGQGISSIDQKLRSPFLHQYSVDLQRLLPGNINLSVGYVGSLSPRLVMLSGLNANQLPYQYMSLGSRLSGTVANPYYQAGGPGFIGSRTITLAQSLLPYPQFTTVTISTDRDHARYDSMVLKLQKRMRQGLTFVSSWTWSKSMDASYAGPSNALNSDGGVQDAYNYASEYTLSYVNTPHRWTTAVTYELPFGKGKTFAVSNRIADRLIGGWSVNAVSAYQSGFPLAVTQQSNNNAILGASQRPSATGISPETSGSLQQRIDGYINSAAFSQAAPYTFGNLSRSISMRGPGEANWDISIFKTVSIGETIRAQFRAESYNAFNTPHFQRPNVSFGSSTFGAITSQANFPRLIQLGVRVYF